MSARDARDEELREEILRLLVGGSAHPTFEQAVEGFPSELRGKTLAGASHTPWQVLEHLRLAQWDILEFCRNPSYESPKWPEGFWPKDSAPPDDAAWDAGVTTFLEDRAQLTAWIKNPSANLLSPVPDQDGPSLLHELVILAQHNSYHIGQLLLLRRALER